MTRLPILIIVSIIFIIGSNAGDFNWTTPETAMEECDGSMTECLAGEFDMDSEISRRILATTKYISYGALQRNNVPCSKKGASYYNCKTGAEANPYQRGCSAITKCRS